MKQTQETQETQKTPADRLRSLYDCSQAVYEEGEEPDPRFTLANERTFLAWQRTALAFMAGGVGIEALTAHSAGRDVLAAVLVVIGIGCAVVALRRWAGAERALRAGRPLPRFRFAPVLTATLVLIGCCVTLMIVTR